MIGRAAALRSGAAAWRRRWALAGLVALALVLLLLVNAATPYLFLRTTLQSEIATQVRVTTGLALTAGGHARFDLLPSPRVKITNIHVSDPSGTVTLDAEAMTGEVRLLPLLVGRIELASASLLKPRLAIDLDGRPMPPDSIIGRAMQARIAKGIEPGKRLGVVTLVDGVAALRSRSLPDPPAFSAIDLTIDWRDLDSPATLTGSMRVAGTAADVAAWIEQPSALMRGERSASALRIHSAPLDLSASGDVASAGTASFKGHLTASAPSLTRLIALGANDRSALPAPFANLALDGDATLSLDPARVVALDLPKLVLHADGNIFEGTLAYQGGAKPLLSGTLAAEQLSLAPFLAARRPFVAPGGGWSLSPLASIGPGPLALDLRISAARLRLAPLTVEDAALSVMTRDRRTEVGLVEGRAYGGTIKGRVSLATGENGLDLRGSGSLAGADASTLSWDMFGRQLAAGTMSGSASFETAGFDAAELMTHLGGWAKGRAEDGEISGVDLGLGLRELARGRPAGMASALRAGRTPFRSLFFDLRLADGIATLGDVSLQGADSTVKLGGSIDVGARRLDLHALAETPDIATSGPRAKLPFDIKGGFDAPALVPDVAPTAPATPAHPLR